MTPTDLIERYRSAFVRGDVETLLGCFAFPLQVVSITDSAVSVSVADGETWPEMLRGILGAYQRLAVDDAVPLEREVSEPMDGLATVRVHWSLHRADGAAVYDFTAVYTLARQEGELRVVAIAHNERPKMRAALSRVEQDGSGHCAR